MGLPRSTIEKHIRVLFEAGLVEKMPSLNSKGQLRIHYGAKDLATDLIYVVKGSLRI